MKNAKSNSKTNRIKNRLEQLNVRPALTLLPHKIPNSHSIGVRIGPFHLTGYLEDALGKGPKWISPYKKSNILANNAYANLLTMAAKKGLKRKRT
jgi:hypothetical protein